MGFSANFVRAQRKTVNGRDAIFVEGISQDMDERDEPWASLTPEDVQAMYVTILSSNGNGARLRRLGAAVERVTGSADWSVVISREHDDDPELPRAGHKITVVGVTTFAERAETFCWSNSMKVLKPSQLRILEA